MSCEFQSLSSPLFTTPPSTNAYWISGWKAEKTIFGNSIKDTFKVSDLDFIENTDRIESIASHNGYERNFGCIHKRKISIDKSTNNLSGYDELIKTKDELRLMDWEFAGNNDPFYDIACFGNNDFNHALALLPVYLGREATISESHRLYFYRAFQCLQWHNVALYKEFIGLSIDLGVDFMFVSNLYLDKAENFLNNIK